MRVFSMAVKNLRKQLRFYFLYLISVAFVIMVFFAFTSFSCNAVMLEKISADGRVETMCRIIAVFLMVFVVFYMTYSNRFFLRRRSRELGIYGLLGYRKSTILFLLTMENVLICLGALIAGSILGACLHQGIVFSINGLLHLGLEHGQIPWFSFRAIQKTGLFVLAVIVVLACSNGRFLYKSSLMNLIRYEKSVEKRMRFHKSTAMLGLFLVLSGYLLALNILAGADSLWIRIGFYPVGLWTMFSIGIGTVFLIGSFLPYAVQKGKERKSRFYTSTGIITTPGFVYRIRSNAKALILLTLLSAGVLTISSVMALTLYYPIASVARIAPSEIEFRLEEGRDLEEVQALIRSYASGAEFSLLQTEIYKVEASGDFLPAEYGLGASAEEGALREEGFECISYSQYVRLLTAQGRGKAGKDLPKLAENEVILIQYEPDRGQAEMGSQYLLQLLDTQRAVTVKAVSGQNVISFANSLGTLIVSDQLYANMAETVSPYACVVSLNGESVERNESLYLALSAYLQDSPYLQSSFHRIQELLYLNSSTFLLIGFLVVLFFIAVGSILYFHMVSMAADSRADYEILGKMGYTKRQLKSILKKQVFAFFGIPFFLGLLDCIFAVMVYRAGLMQNILGNTVSQYVPALLAVGVTALIYGIYYGVTVRACCKAAI